MPMMCVQSTVDNKNDGQTRQTSHTAQGSLPNRISINFGWIFLLKSATLNKAMLSVIVRWMLLEFQSSFLLQLPVVCS